MELIARWPGIRYGIGLLGRVAIVLLGSVGVGGLGWIIAGGGMGTTGRLFGGLLFISGMIVLISGLMGILYVVIADAVVRAEQLDE
jgi:hypothetical protein